MPMTSNKPTYRVLKKLCPMSTSRMSAILTADGCLASDADGQIARWAKYFENLLQSLLIKSKRLRLRHFGIFSASAGFLQGLLVY